TEAETDSLRAQSDGVDTPALGRMLEILTESEGRLKEALSRKILLEVTLLKASEARNAMSLDTVLRELNALRGGSGVPAAAGSTTRSHVPASPAPPAVPIPSARPSSSPAAPSVVIPEAPELASSPPAAEPADQGPSSNEGTVSLHGPELEATWTQLLASMKTARAFAHRYLAKAFPVSLEDGVLTIGFDEKSAEYIPLVDSAKTHGVVTNLLAQQGHAGCRVAFTQARRPSAQAPTPTGNSTPARAETAPVAETDAGNVPAAPSEQASADPLANFDPAKFKDDPEIQEALAVFKARIVQVIPPSKRAEDKP
ncbi:MAG: hypothetical protein KDM81_07585, partial [Verrucomicrobiae bacterium]|nr:hypothetical protein [Verrucomicrobiae bacterium]